MKDQPKEAAFCGSDERFPVEAADRGKVSTFNHALSPAKLSPP
jgi:hypothetical protein